MRRRSVFSVFSVLSVLSAAAAAGCGGDLSFCDIRDEACRADIFYAVLDARGDAWDAWSKPPPSRVITEEELRRRLLAELGPPSPPTTWDRALTLLDLLEPSTSSGEATVDTIVKNAAAFYSSESKTVTIIDHGGAPSKDRDTQVLAHEYVHALQDRYDGLEHATADVRSSDQLFARRAFIEGEAGLYEALVSPSLGKDWLARFDPQPYAAALRERLIADAGTSGALLLNGMQWLVYPLGDALLMETYVDGGNLAVRAGWDDLPDRSLDLVVPFGVAAPAAEPLACRRPAPPPGHALSGDDRFGAIGVYIAAAGRWLTLSRAWELAAAWRNDGIWTYSTEDGGGTVVLWRIRWASADDAAAVADGIAAYAGAADWRVELAGVELTIAATDTPTLLDTWTSWRCPGG